MNRYRRTRAKKCLTQLPRLRQRGLRRIDPAESRCIKTNASCCSSRIQCTATVLYASGSSSPPLRKPYQQLISDSQSKTNPATCVGSSLLRPHCDKINSLVARTWERTYGTETTPTPERSRNPVTPLLCMCTAANSPYVQ